MVNHLDDIYSDHNLTLSVRRARYIDPSHVASFQKACTEAAVPTIKSALQPFFAVWKTSLMRSDVEKLRRVSLDDHLCTLVETILVADDCERVDPWAISALPSADSSYEIWPRNDTGIVLTSEVGVADLKTLLQERRLRPKIIKIRDYQIAPVNLEFSPEMSRIRDLVKDIVPATAEPVPVATLARNVIDGANLAVTSLAIQHASLPLAEDSLIHSGRFKNSALGDPKIQEAIIELSPEHHGVGQGKGFSMLHSADLLLGCEATPYWLEQVFYKAIALKTLKLSIKYPGGPWLTAGRAVVPKLTTFALSHTRISAEDIVAMISSSKDSLTNVRLRQVTLNEDGSTWRELLSLITKEYKALTSFSLAILRDETGGSMAIDFRNARKDHILEECQPGLSLVEKGPPHNRRVTKVSYDGPNAGYVLEILTGLVQVAVPNDQDVISRLPDD